MLARLCVSTWDMEWHGMTWIHSAAAHWQEWVSWSETVPAGLHLQTIQAFSWEWLRKLECFGMKWMSFPPFDGALNTVAVNQHSPPFVKPYTFKIEQTRRQGALPSIRNHVSAGWSCVSGSFHTLLRYYSHTMSTSNLTACFGSLHISWSVGAIHYWIYWCSAKEWIEDH